MMNRMKHLLRTACLLLLVVAGLVGTTARSVLALESMALESSAQDTAGDGVFEQAMSHGCPPNVVGELSGLNCEGEGDDPARQASCPMMAGSCVNMSAASSHCGLVSVTYVSAIPDAATAVVPVVFLRSAVLGTGRVADPIFHPPIL